MEKLNKILNSYMVMGNNSKDKIQGASFIVTNKDGIVYKGAAGRIGLAADSPSFNSESSGWIASMTKIVTAMSLMQIVERRLISLDDDVHSLVPELANAQILRLFDSDDNPVLEDNTGPISLRQLLCHTSGMSYDLVDPDLQKWSSMIGRTAGFLDQTREGSYMSENIFKPLGMSDTTFRRQSIVDRLTGRIIECSHRNLRDDTLSVGPLSVSEDPPLDSGGAGLFSTPQDYIKFLQAVLAAGEGQGTLLRKQSVEEMFRPQLNEAQSTKMKTWLGGALPFQGQTPVNHGISGAINMGNIEGKRRKGTLTWAGMSNPQWWIDREAGIAAVLFVNILPPDDEPVKRMYDELERAVYGDFLTSLKLLKSERR